MALTPFQTKKLTYMFHLFDVDGNGTVEANDYERRTQYLAEHRGYPEGSDEYVGLHARIMKDWDQLQMFADTDGDGHVTKFEFLEFADYILSDESIWHESSLDTARFVIDTCDLDGDGKVTLEEYGIFFKAYELSDESIQFAFNKLDADGDGLVTVEEITAALDQFGKSDNPDDPGNYMFGHLD